MINEIKKEYKKRIDELLKKIDFYEKQIEEKQKIIMNKMDTEKINKEIEKKKELLMKLEKEIQNKTTKIKYYVEKKWNGFHVSVHKKGDKVKIFSEQLKDITNSFPTLVEQIKKLSNEDFVIDGEIVPYDDNGKTLGRDELIKYIESKTKPSDKNIKLHVWDIVYYDNEGKNGNLTDLPLYERKMYLEKLKFNDRITNTPYEIVSNRHELISAIKKMTNMEGSEGAVIKKADSTYEKGKNNNWIKYRHLLELKVINLKKFVTKDGKAYNYEFGILVPKKEIKFLDDRYIVKTPRGYALKLAKTFNTKLNIPQYATFTIQVQEVWRHESKHGIRYSVHKPKVKDYYHESENKQTSTIDDLEDIVTSVGVAVVEKNNSILLEFSSDPEGKHGNPITKWPQWMQIPLKQVVEKKLWLPFVLQHHYRGHKVKPSENLPEKYKYNLRSVHSDLRCFLPYNIDKMKDSEIMKYEEAKNVDGVCFGITINTPPSVDKPDEFNDNAKNILCEFKLPIPKEWLYVEAVFEKGSVGATANAPGVMVIVAKGEYTCHVIEDHKLLLEFRTRKGKVNKHIFEEADAKGIYIKNKYSDELKQLHSLFNFTINHIGDKHIILCNAVDKKNTEFDLKDTMNLITVMTEMGYSRREIANAINSSKTTVYRYQKQLGLL